jgi:hypothetical protein
MFNPSTHKKIKLGQQKEVYAPRPPHQNFCQALPWAQTSLSALLDRQRSIWRVIPMYIGSTPPAVDSSALVHHSVIHAFIQLLSASFSAYLLRQVNQKTADVVVEAQWKQ